MESNKESEKHLALSRALSERGFLVLRFDFSYAGESSGRFEEITYSNGVEDLRAAWDWLERYPAEKIGLIGSSMGGSVALLFAAQEKRVAALVTIAAPLHPERIVAGLISREEIERWRQMGFVTYHGRRIRASLLEDVEKINIPEAAQKISCPVLVIHGDEDETVPVAEASELSSRLSGPKRICILKGADHRLSNPSDREKALREALDWMTRHLGGS